MLHQVAPPCILHVVTEWQKVNETFVIKTPACTVMHNGDIATCITEFMDSHKILRR